MRRGRRFLVAGAVTAIAAICIATTAGSAGAADPLAKRVSKLERQVSKLQGQVASMQGANDSLEDRVSALEQTTDAGLLACLSSEYVSQYDDYLADDGVTSITGLDYDSAASADIIVVTWVCPNLP